MIQKNNLLFLLGGLGAGLIVALLLAAVPAVPHASLGTVNATFGPVVPIASSQEEIRQFFTEADAEAFLKARISPEELQVLPENASGSAAFQHLLANGTRRWSYAVDTSTFKPDEYLVVATAVMQDAQSTTLFNILEPSSTGVIPRTPPAALPRPGSDGYFIAINPVRDHYIGDRFTISGYTNLPKGAEILVEVYSSSFKPTQKSQSGEFSGSAGTISTSGDSSFSASPSSATSPAVQGSAWSGTNVQVRGVEEADIIKTDGTYIYAITGNTLAIVQASPPESARVLASRQFSGTPQYLYQYGNRLVLITETEEPEEYWDCGTGPCRNYPLTPVRTGIFIFSVEDPANPSLVREIKMDGRYEDSRMIGPVLYSISTGTVDPYAGAITFPEIDDSAAGTATPRVYYFNATDNEYALTTIGSVDVSANEPVRAKTFLIGSAGTVYVSPARLYIAVPEIVNFRSGKTGGMTSIYAFSLDDGEFSYAARGTVEGTLLNQFSLDEYGGYLRVATTQQGWTRGQSARSSTVSVLNRQLDTVGTLAGLAPGETIYAARFMGDRLYLVTFRETDPLFVIDLSNPGHLKVLGELHIPGFSQYLHPYDATHLIGIGKESTWGGLKIALFDVTDVHNPHLVDEEKLGGYGSDSEVLRDHRAFLFDREKSLLVLPARIVEPAVSPRADGTSEWSGAYVFKVSPDRGFSLNGTVVHHRGPREPGTDVRRSLYIDNVLYTMSPEKIVLSDLANATHLIGEVRFR